MTEPTVVRNSRGLSIAGTRITLYSIMDYVKKEWSPKQIQALFSLTDKQIADVMAYIEANREEVEIEYQEVLRYAEEVREYWEERNQEFVKVSAMEPPPGKEELWAKLQAWKDKLELESEAEDDSHLGRSRHRRASEMVTDDA